jgi:hypothetical protein
MNLEPLEALAAKHIAKTGSRPQVVSPGFRAHACAALRSAPSFPLRLQEGRSPSTCSCYPSPSPGRHFGISRKCQTTTISAKHGTVRGCQAQRSYTRMTYRNLLPPHRRGHAVGRGRGGESVVQHKHADVRVHQNREPAGGSIMTRIRVAEQHASAA